jgi:protein-tyrosine-phosphatase/8-oxo-dGTP pyrophosphatase MutT (NUDIX family)
MKQKPYVIHFVCRGNTYRSRLAAAYMASLLDDRFVVTSSGIGTHLAPTLTSEAYTKATAKAHALRHGIAAHKTQTTDALLGAADVVVFMNKDVYDEALKDYDFDVRKVLVWHVKDMDPAVKARILADGSEQALVSAAAASFATIRTHCDELYGYLTRGSWVDVVDKQDRPTEIRLPISWVSDRGLWHRGVHVVVRTADGKFVVGKRGKAMIFAPGMLEITLGGAIDSGEHPLTAAQRETHEELGVHIAQKDFRPLFRYRQVGYHPHYHKQTRAHLYVYAVTLPVHSARLRPQPGEVEELRVLTKRQVKHVLHTHRMEHFGRLKWGYKLYGKAVAMSQLPL